MGGAISRAGRETSKATAVENLGLAVPVVVALAAPAQARMPKSAALKVPIAFLMASRFIFDEASISTP
jgi:hypothetical protein